MNSEITLHLRAMTRAIYIVTDEEDRFLVDLKTALKSFVDRTWVFNPAHGMLPLTDLVNDWQTRAHRTDNDTLNIHAALEKIYKDDPKDKQNFYVLLDPERYLTEAHVCRRILNILHQGHQNDKVIKILIMVGSRKFIPEKLSRYIEVVQDTGLDETAIKAIVQEAATNLKNTVPPDAGNLFKGMTSYEMLMSISQSVIRTKADTENPKRIDPTIILDYKRNQLRKTDLLSYVDTDRFNFDQVGGAGRFKEWAYTTRACWSDAGKAFGLKPPKGVLCVGVWGCGKSLSVKAMGKAWGLPVVQLEMGRLRSSGVGESEANVYKAIKLIEQVSPCIVWIDEAEKSLAGGASSGASDAGTLSRTIGILSTWLQETTAQVTLAMTANSLKTLPIEFVNRMDERFFFDMPSEEDRVDILKIHLTKKRQDPSTFNLAKLAQDAKLMVGREIEQAIDAAMTKSFLAKKSGLDEDILSTELIKKPRIIKTMIDEVKEVLDWVGYDKDADEGIRARFASKPAGNTLSLIAGDG